MLSLINNEQDIVETYLYAKDPYEEKYQLAINKRENTGLTFLMIRRLLLNIQMIWMIFTKMLKNTIQKKN